MFTEETQSKRDEKYANLKRKFADSRQVKFFFVNALYFFIKLLSPNLHFYRNRMQYSMSWLVSRIKGWSGKRIIWNQLILPVVIGNNSGGTDRKLKRSWSGCPIVTQWQLTFQETVSARVKTVYAKREFMYSWQKQSTIWDAKISQLKLRDWLRYI